MNWREEVTGNMVEKIRKRDGRIVEFDKSKIANAVFKAFLATKSKDGKKAEDIATIPSPLKSVNTTYFRYLCKYLLN